MTTTKEDKGTMRKNTAWRNRSCVQYNRFWSEILCTRPEPDSPRSPVFAGEEPMHSLIARCPVCGARNNIPLAKQHLSPKCGRCKHPLALHGQALPVPLTDSDFAPFIAGAPLPLVVDFYSPTCGPCRTLAPVIDRLAGRFWGRAIIAKLDTSRNPTIAARYQIRGVPTLLFFKNGQLADQIVGAIPEPQLTQRIEALCG